MSVAGERKAEVRKMAALIKKIMIQIRSGRKPCMFTVKGCM